MTTSEMVFMLGAGVGFLVVGLVVVWRQIEAARGLEKLIVCGPSIVASALAAFGAEHFILGRGMISLVPLWLPVRMFWVYFFGVALFSAALSFVIRKAMGAAAWGLALMFFILVACTSLPGLAAHPGNRLLWVLTLRESSFGMACVAFAGWLTARAWTTCGRYFFGLVAVVYGVVHWLQPGHVWGVPLEKLTPAWVPAPEVWAWLVGAMLVGGGAGMLARSTARRSGALVGLVLTLVTVGLYVPIFLMASRAGWLEGLNYIFDTLLYAGSALLVAGSVGRSRTTA